VDAELLVFALVIENIKHYSHEGVYEGFVIGCHEVVVRVSSSTVES
jgi:hypothetical protein